MIPSNGAGEASIVITFDFKYKWSDSVLPTASLAAQQQSEIVLGQCDDPSLVANEDYFLRDEVRQVRLTREMFRSWQVPSDIFTYSTYESGKDCSGTYTQTAIRLLLSADKTDVSNSYGGLSIVPADFRFEAEETA